MAITAPGNFTCGKTTVHSGEEITCTWTASSGDFDHYHIMFAYPNAFRNFYPSKDATSYRITLESSEDLTPAGYDTRVSIAAEKGPQGMPTESSESAGFDLYFIVDPPKPSAPSMPGGIFVSGPKQGESFMISWAASSGSVDTYTLQRSVNGGAFETVYAGAETSYTDTAGMDWVTVNYRVQANGSGGDSSWAVSGSVPVKSSITLPPGGRLEQLENRDAKPVFPLTVTEGVFRQSDGKNLERILADMELGVTGPAGAAGPGVPTGGATGQMLVKKSGTDYDTEWADAPASGGTAEPGTGGVTSFKGRTGAVTPQSGDYTAAQVGAVPTSRKVNGQALSSDITLITCGTTDMTAGSSSLAAGTLYGVYEV